MYEENCTRNIILFIEGNGNKTLIIGRVERLHYCIIGIIYLYMSIQYIFVYIYINCHYSFIFLFAENDFLKLFNNLPNNNYVVKEYFMFSH